VGGVIQEAGRKVKNVRETVRKVGKGSKKLGKNFMEKQSTAQLNRLDEYMEKNLQSLTIKQLLCAVVSLLSDIDKKITDRENKSV